MLAYYYRIYDVKIPSYTIEEGIIKDCEDTIYPAQNSSSELDKYPDLPHECEAHHFKCLGTKIEGYYFNIPVEILNKYKVK
jgi:hypothetical protein